MKHEPISIPLSQPLSAWGKPITELVFNPPKGKDILQAGYPWQTEINPRTGGKTESVNMQSMRLLLARMALVPETTIDDLEAVDLYRAVEAVKFFFHYRIQKTTSTSSSGSEDGSEMRDSSSN